MYAHRVYKVFFSVSLTGAGSAAPNDPDAQMGEVENVVEEEKGVEEEISEGEEEENEQYKNKEGETETQRSEIEEGTTE